MNSLNPNTNAWGRISFTPSGATFDYSFSGSNLTAANGHAVKLIYFAGTTGAGLRCIGGGTVSGGTLTLSGSINLNTSIAAPGKIRLIHASDLNCATQLITAASPRYYLYEASDESIVYTDTNVSNTLDTVDLGGNTAQEVAHGVIPATSGGSWSDAWRYDANWGGGYGNGVALLKTLRLVQGRGDGCLAANNDGFATFDVGADAATKIIVEHLDGSADDYFDVYVNNVNVGSHTNDFAAGENWHDNAVNAPPNGTEFPATQFTLPTPVTGAVSVNIYLTSPDAGTCAAWGQLGIDSITLGK